MKTMAMDIKNAFLYVELDREIYMEHPQGFQSKLHPEHVCKLKKSITDFWCKVATQWLSQIQTYFLKIKEEE